MRKYLDLIGLLYFWQQLKNILNTKVDKVSGKGLSTEDYTTAEKSKLLGAATQAQYTATVSTSWSGNGPYTQSVTVSGLSSNDSPIVGPVLSATLETRQAQQEAWNMVSRITTSNNTLILTCDEDKPTVAIPIQIMSVR